MESHQKNSGGNARIAETMFRYFRFPMDFGNFCYLSQVQQGLAMRTAVEYWRSLKPHCMGTLYWQLNDTWPVASWSSLDHGGGWKAMHYMARRFFAPLGVFAIPEKNGNSMRIVAVNDSAADARVDVTLFSIALDGAVTDCSPMHGAVSTDKATTLGHVTPRDGEILFFSWCDAQGRTLRNHATNQPCKSLALQPPRLNHVVSKEGVSLRIDINADALSLYVMAETDVEGGFSDNVVDILPGETATLVFTPDDPARIDEAWQSLVIRDLYSSSLSTKG